MRNFQKYVGCVAPTRTALSERSLARRVQFFKMKHCVDALKTCQICQITAGCGQKFMNSSSEVGEDNIKVLTTAADMLSFWYENPCTVYIHVNYTYAYGKLQMCFWPIHWNRK